MELRGTEAKDVEEREGGRKEGRQGKEPKVLETLIKSIHHLSNVISFGVAFLVRGSPEDRF